MTNISKAAAASLAALLSLAACQSEPEVVGGQTDPQAEALRNAPPVELPPSMIARTYRCSDNSLVYVDFASDGRFARIGSAQISTSRVRVDAAEPNSNYTGEGYTISANAEETRIKMPGKAELSCRAGDR